MYFFYNPCKLSKGLSKQAEHYWKSRPQQMAAGPSCQSSSAKNDGTILSDFDRHRQSLLKKGTSAETWGAEVRRYLKEVEEDVTKDTDIIKWWQVCYIV